MRTVEVSSAVDSVFRTLRRAILIGELEPGSGIRVRDLEESLGVSHIPIREALRRLEAEGLVITRARRKPVVAGVDLDDLDAIYQTRRLIELPLVRHARAGATDGDLAAVRDALAAYERLADAPEEDDYWDNHTRFHWSLIAPASNSWTKRVLDPLWQASERYIRIFVYRCAGDGEALELHRELGEAFYAGPQEAERELGRHFDLTVAGVRAGFARESDPGTSQETALGVS